MGFLPKQNKRNLTPGDLRPIALLEPCGKAIMGALSKKLLAEVGLHPVSMATVRLLE